MSNRQFLKSPAELRLSRIPTTGVRSKCQQLIEQTSGIIELEPEFVPRDFLPPGNRLGVVLSDQTAYGPIRGKLAERWIGSDTSCDNGPMTLSHEGISKARLGSQLIPLTVLLQEFGQDLLGHLWGIFGGPHLGYYNKYFDFGHPIFHHLHQKSGDAWIGDKPSMIGKVCVGKHEGYEHLQPRNTARPMGDQNHTFFGLRHDVTHYMLAEALEAWFSADNGILSLSQGAQMLSSRLNWFIPSGYLHAPGSELTMEPQEGTDVFSMEQNVISGRGADIHLHAKNYDPAIRGNIDAMAKKIDLTLNKRPATDFMIVPSIRAQGKGWVESWRIYGTDPDQGYVPFVLTKTTLAPGASVIFSGETLHNVICTEGHGTIGTENDSHTFQIQAPSCFYFGRRSQDEYLITADRAKSGVKYVNTGNTPLVVYRCFGRDSFPVNILPKVGSMIVGLAPTDVEQAENKIYLAC